MSKITFIVPSIGRETLVYTIESLENQTNTNWNAIIMFDGCSPTFESKDPRIRIMETEKLGQGHNSAGLVRNAAIKHAETEWVAFVDDDDTLARNYVETFYNETAIDPKSDVIMFRMMHYGIVLPPLSTDTFYRGNVGISFAMRVSIFHAGMVFAPDTYEDYNILHMIRENKYRMMISPFVRYFVRNQYSPEQKEHCSNDGIIGNRVIIQI